MIIALVGCSSYKTDLNPVDTTYPRDPRVVESVGQIGGVDYGWTMTFKILGKTVEKKRVRGEERLSHDTFETVTGDDATIETFVHDRKRINATQKQLLTIAKQRGPELCGGRFAIIETTYFYGDEATPRFYGLSNVKSMRVLFRCPLAFSPAATSENHDLIALAGELLWPGYFDILTFEFKKNPQELLDDVKAAAEKHGIVLHRAGRLDNSRFFYIGSGDTSSRSIFKRVEQLAAIVEPAQKGSRLRIIFPAMRIQRIRTSVSVIRRVSDEWGDLVPWERSIAYDRARYFLSVVRDVSAKR